MPDRFPQTAANSGELGPESRHSRQDVRDAAAAYTRLGYGVFPLKRGQKVPATSHGLRDARWTEEKATALLSGHGDCNLAILPPENVLVLDVDEPDRLPALVDNFPELDAAPRHDTPRGGSHLFVRLPNGVTLSTRTKAAEGVDLRGMNRAYLVAPPSWVGDKGYTVVRPLVEPDRLPLASPELLDYLEPAKATSTQKRVVAVPSRSGRAFGYGQRALEVEAQKVRTSKCGERNIALNAAAFSLGQLIAGGVLTRDEVEGTLLGASRASGYLEEHGESATRRTIASGLQAGMLEPRTPPARGRPSGAAGDAQAPAKGDGDDEHSVQFEDLRVRAEKAELEDLPRILQDLYYLEDTGARNAQRDAIFQALKQRTGVGMTALKRDFAALQSNEEPERQTIAQQLLTLAFDAGLELWHDPDGEPYATLQLETHQEHHRLKTQGVKRYLQRLWYRETGSTVGREPLSEALGVLEGQAIHDGEEHPAFIRVAETGAGPDTAIVIDMCDDSRHVIEVTRDGWRIITSQENSVRFIRTPGMLALPTPQPGDLHALSEALGIPAAVEDGSPNRAFQGAVAWLLQAFRMDGPFPILALFGEQGAGKSNFTRRLCSLLDPHTATLRVLSRDDRDIVIAARNSWLQAKDNVSQLNHWTSDAFCRLATGGALSTRTLYTNDEETILNAKRPLLLNGITNFLEQQDLVDRALVVTLPAIAEQERLPETELQRRYDEIRPAALGALLDCLVMGLKRSGERHLRRLPRMADFAEWIVACSPALNWDPEDFMTWYDGSKKDVMREALEACIIMPHLVAVISEAGGTWTGTASDLLAALEDAAGISVGRRAPKGWPKKPQGVTNELKRILPALRAVEGVDAFQDRLKDKRLWTLHTVNNKSSPSSPDRWTRQEDRDGHDFSGDDSKSLGRHRSSPSSPDDDAATTPLKRPPPDQARPGRDDNDGDDDGDQLQTLSVASERGPLSETTAASVKRRAETFPQTRRFGGVLPYSAWNPARTSERDPPEAKTT